MLYQVEGDLLLSRVLRHLAQLIDAETFVSVALPRLVTGVGGLAWDEVLPLIEKYLGHKEIPVYVYSVFRPDVRAEEPVLPNRQTA